MKFDANSTRNSSMRQWRGRGNLSGPAKAINLVRSEIWDYEEFTDDAS